MLAILNSSRCQAEPHLILGTNSVAQGHSTQLPLWLAGGDQLAGFQTDLVFDTGALLANGIKATTSLSGVIADAGIVATNRLRVLVLSTNRAALGSGLMATLQLNVQPNAQDGWRTLPLRSSPEHVGITLGTNGACGSIMTYQAGALFVGNTFGPTPEGGRAQFRASEGSRYVILANDILSEPLAEWTPIGTNLGLNGLVFWIDRDTTNHPTRFYGAREQ